MLAYVLLISIPVLFLFVRRNHENIRLLDVGIGNKQIGKENLAIPIFFLCLFVMLSVRHETVGCDLKNYRDAFERYNNISFYELLFSQTLRRTDNGFMMINWLVGQITDSYQLYLSIVAAITLIPICLLYCEDRNYSYLKILLFVNMATFVMMFSGLRQSIAIGCACWAYRYTRKKDWKKFLIIALLALSIHHSAFVLVCLYPVYHCKIRKNHLLFVIPIILAVFIFNRQIFGMVSEILIKYSDRYEAEISSTGAYMMLILFSLFLIFSFLVPDEKRMTKEDFGLRNILIMTVLLQCFAPVHYTAMRLNYYFIIFIPVAIPKMIMKTSKQYEQIASFASVVLTLFFLYFYLDSIYTSYITGISDLDTVPYIPFWKG